MNLQRLFTTLLVVFAAGHLFGQDLKYKPINPAFGGESYNYTWLLSQAQAQKSGTGHKTHIISSTRCEESIGTIPIYC